MVDIVLFQPSIGFYTQVVKEPPISLLSISRFLDLDGYKIKIIDQNINEKWEKELINEIEKTPICFGTTATTGKQILNALKASKIVKKISNVPVIWGESIPQYYQNKRLKMKISTL